MEALVPGAGAGAVRSVQLWGRKPGTTKANKIPVPEGATVIWASGRQDELTLETLDSGASRDVFKSLEGSYVLKLQTARWHVDSNAAEAMLGQTTFAQLTPETYGSILTLHEGERVSVLVAERVEHTYSSWCKELVGTPLDFASLKLLMMAVAAFFNLVVQGAGVMGYQLKDLHWKNVGITKEQAPTAQTRAPHCPRGSALGSTRASRLCNRGASGSGASVCADGGSRCD